MANPCGAAVDHMLAGELGYIDTPAQGNRRPADVWWCADNGCFSKGYPGDTEWFRWLDGLPWPREQCIFAVAPDVVGDAAATLERSVPWLPQIRALGYKAAFVSQDGLTPDTTPWDQFDALFIGGSTEWKLGHPGMLIVIRHHVPPFKAQPCARLWRTCVGEEGVGDVLPP